jgi:hypothetical protein
MAKLESLIQNQLKTMPDSPEKTAYQSEATTFTQSTRNNWIVRTKSYEQVAPLQAKLIQDSVSPSEKQAIVEKILETDKANANLLVQSAYYSAMDEQWEQALDQTKRLLKTPGRESAPRLAGGLLEPLILNKLGRPDDAKTSLEAFQKRIEDPWYKEISACLLDLTKEKSLAEKAGQQPAFLVTGHTALGLWAEGNDLTKQALRYYKEALGSYRDDRIEYHFARERIERLQKTNAK